MINSNNIAEIFNFVKNQKNFSNLCLEINKKKISIAKNKKNANLVVTNKNIVIKTNINLILRQCCEIIIPLLLKNNSNLI